MNLLYEHGDFCPDPADVPHKEIVKMVSMPEIERQHYYGVLQRRMLIAKVSNSAVERRTQAQLILRFSLTHDS